MGDWGKQREQMGKGAGNNFNALDFSKVDGKHEFYKLVEGGQKFNIIPFPIGKKHPLVAKGALDKGDLFYSLPLYVHKDVGAGRKSIACPNKNYGKPCPICELAEEMNKTARTKEEKDAVPYARLRLFYNIVDCDNPDKGLQIFETNAKDFEKPLKAAQDDADKEAAKKGKEVRFFADIEKGLTVKIIGAEDYFNGKKFIKASSVTLVAREDDVSEFEDDAIGFDRLIEEMSYDDIAALMNGADTEEEEESPARKKVARDEDDDEPPARKKIVKEDDDEAPLAKKVAKEEEDVPKCPVKGGVFGRDNGDFPDDCDACKLWGKCAKAQR